MMHRLSLLAAALGCSATIALPANRQGSPAELVFVNGTILTMDASSSIAAGIAIDGGLIVAVGDVSAQIGPLTQVIDLGGSTVVPGLIDTHVHFTRDAQAPGHRLHGVETAFSIPDILTVIGERASSVPTGEFLTLIGGIRAKQFAENRLPTLSEMDAAAPNHPVYLQQSFTGPAVTNSLGIIYFQNHSVTVNANGTIPGSSQSALDALVGDLTAQDADRAMREYIAYSDSVGLTGVIDFGGSLSSVPSPAVTIPYDLWSAGELNIRFHKGIGANGPPVGGVYPIIPVMLAALAELAAQGGGDDLLDVDRTGEFIVGGFGSTTADFVGAFGQVAAQGWAFSQHSISGAENNAHISAFETVNATTPIAPLRWSLDHVFSISSTNLVRLVSLGVGVGVQNQQYFISGGGPPYRDIVNSGVRAGAGTDATMVAPLTPWASIYYMVSGRDVAGTLINAGQEITRMEALRLYTAGSAWFTFDDDKLGSLEVGKLADLVVLSDDYLSMPEADIRNMTSVLTLLGGEVVHAEPPFCDAGLVSSNYCVAQPNSTGSTGSIGVAGSASIAANTFTLTAQGATPNQFAIFFYGPEQAQLPLGDGFLCIGSGTTGLFRLNPPQLIEVDGSLTHAFDFDATPANAGAGEVLPGSTWNFQMWYRDPGGAGSNLTDAVSVTFCN